MDRLPELADAVQDLSETVDRRLILVDEQLQVVAYSIHESPADRRRLFHVLAHSDSWPTPPTNRNPHHVVDLPEVGPLLFLRLVDSRKQIIGHLLTPADGSAGEPGPQLRAAVHRLATLLSARRDELQERSDLSQRLAVELLSEIPGDRVTAAESLLQEQLLSSADRYCAVALGVDPRLTAPGERAKAALAVARTLRFVRESSTATVIGATLDEGVGVLVFPRPVVTDRLARIIAHPELRPVRAGIGPLGPLEQVHRSFARARLAWRASWLAPEDHGIVATWEGVGLDGTLARLPLEDFGVADLPPALTTLLRTVDSPDLLATLEAYLDAGGDARRTAKSLNIHRSTLYYRLDKLRAGIAGDLGEGVLRRELHTGLRMARLAGLLPGR